MRTVVEDRRCSVLSPYAANNGSIYCILRGYFGMALPFWRVHSASVASRWRYAEKNFLRATVRTVYAGVQLFCAATAQLVNGVRWRHAGTEFSKADWFMALLPPPS